MPTKAPARPCPHFPRSTLSTGTAIRARTRATIRTAGFLTLLILALGSCENGTTSPDVGAEPVLSIFDSGATIRIVSGDGETVSPGATLRKVEIQVVDSREGAVRRAVVHWNVTSGGGSTNHATTRTTGQGRSSVHWTTGPEPGVQTLEARVPEVGAVTFSVIARSDDEEDDEGGPGDGSDDGDDDGEDDEEGPGDGGDGGDDEEDGDDGSGSGTLTASPGNVTLTAIGAEAQLEIEARDAAGDVIANPGVAWSSSDEAVATVDQEGRVLAINAGAAFVIVAAACCTLDSVFVNVEQVVDAVDVTPATTRIAEGESLDLTAEAVDSNGNPIRSATFEWSTGDADVATVDGNGRITGISAGTVRITATSAGVSDDAVVEVFSEGGSGEVSHGIWIGQEELARLPTSGTAWNNVKNAADTNLRGGVLTERDSHNARLMAAALVAARLDDDRYRGRVRDALVDLMDARLNTEDGLAVNRRLGSYAIAADLIGLSTFDSRTDARFREWLEVIRNTRFQSGGGGTPAGYHERRPNNYGTHAGASRMAVALYLDDRADFERALVVFRGYLGDRSAYAGFQYRVDWSWHVNEDRPRGINPRGATKNGRNIDGVMPDDQRRCGTFYDTPWPCTTGYSWEGLQGVVAMAWIAHRQGHPAFEWEDRAILRANRWLYDVNGHPAAGDDTWQPHVINYIYGTSFPAPVPSRHGKNVGWTDWTHGSR